MRSVFKVFGRLGDQILMDFLKICQGVVDIRFMAYIPVFQISKKLDFMMVSPKYRFFEIFGVKSSKW